MLLPAGEADVRGDLLACLDQGDVVDEEADHAFAFPLRGVGIRPEGGEIGCQGTDSGLLFAGEGGGRGGAGVVVVVTGGLQCAQRVVPVGFEAVGDEPVVGVDGEVAAAGEVRVVAGAFDLVAAQRVSFGGAGFDLGPDGEGDLDRERGKGVAAPLLAGPDRLEHAQIQQRRDVTEFAAFGDVTQQPPHDLAAAGLGQLRDHVNLAGPRDRRDLAGHFGA